MRTVISIGADGKLTVKEVPPAKNPDRSHKGKSILAASPNYTVFDIETTGLDPLYDSIIELGAIRYRGREQAAVFSTLVNPGFEIDDYITELTGITNEDLSTAPVLADVLPDYIAFLGQDLLVGHNAHFDVNFVYDACDRGGLAPFSNDFVDTMRLSRRLYPDERHHRLCDLTQRFCIDCHGAHRATADCESTSACYLHMIDDASARSIDLAALSSWQYVKAKDITSTSDTFDPSHPLFGQSCAFTGALQRMTRQEAMQAVVNVGGLCEDRVTKRTNYLILGNNDYCKAIKDGKSNKQKKAEQYKLAGQDIEILSEDVFYDLLGGV